MDGQQFFNRSFNLFCWVSSASFVSKALLLMTGLRLLLCPLGHKIAFSQLRIYTAGTFLMFSLVKKMVCGMLGPS